MLKIEFEEKGHKYTVNGKRVASVTQVTGILEKKALISWAAGVTAEYLISLIPDIKNDKIVLAPEDAKQLFRKAKDYYKEINQKAMDIGTETHNAIEEYLTTHKKPKLSEEAEKPFQAFLVWKKEIRFEEIIASEEKVGSQYGYAGRLDKIFLIHNKNYLVDFKTGKDFYEPEQPMQLAAYRCAYLETYPKRKIDGMGILRLDKITGLPYWREYSNEQYEKYIQMFLCLLNYLEIAQL